MNALRTRLVSLSLIACACGGSESRLPEGTTPPREQPPHTVGELSIELPAMTLEPGDERLPCYIFPIEVQGASRVVGGAVLETQQGMHHGNITSRPATGEGVRECPPGDEGNEGLDILAGGGVMFASSTQVEGEEWYSFPEGMGYRIDDTHEIVARMHYLNAGEQPLTVAPTYRWFTIDEAKLTHELGPFIWMYQGFEIPPGEDVTVTGECLFRQPEHEMHVVTLLPHMHALGTALWAEIVGGPNDGERFLDSPGYDPEDGVLRQYDPGIDLSAVEGFRFACSWHNSFDFTVVEGIGDNEMCMVFGYAWPRGQAYTALADLAGCLMVPTP
jgi:hypothetical protein